MPDRPIPLTGVADDGAPEPESIIGMIDEATVHLTPPGDSGQCPCCDRTPFELPRADRMTMDRGAVTCKGNQ
jgi:hypothetical protein